LGFDRLIYRRDSAIFLTAMCRAPSRYSVHPAIMLVHLE